MTRILLALLCLATLAAPARAGLTERQIATVGLTPAPDARAPLALPFRDRDGRATTLGAAIGERPTLLMPVDFTCRETCGPALSIAGKALADTGLRAGTDYSLVVVGLDGRAGPEAARAFTEGQVGGPGVAVLSGSAEAIRALTDAVGYHFALDPDNDAVAHPAAFLALTADGRVSRALSSLALGPTDLRLALLEAGEGRVGGLAGKLSLLCYGFDAVHGIYTRRIETVLRIAGAATVAMIAGAIGLMTWRSRRHDARRQGARA